MSDKKQISEKERSYTKEEVRAYRESEKKKRAERKIKADKFRYEETGREIDSMFKLEQFHRPDSLKSRREYLIKRYKRSEKAFNKNIPRLSAIEDRIKTISKKIKEAQEAAKAKVSKPK